MPPKSLMILVRPWKCLQCRTFSATTSNRRLGPEHPDYIPIPQPPQQTLPDRPFIKGRLPVPRDVFAGAEGRDEASPEWLDPHTRPRNKSARVKAGSREEWKVKISDMRRQNLREGLVSLKARRETDQHALKTRSDRNQRERQEALTRPEREDERLTTPSHGLDLDHLFHGYIPGSPGVRPDPTRDERIARMRANVAARAEAARAERASHVNTLYMNARQFIVNPQQLNAAVDEAFGTTENPVMFGDPHSSMANRENAASVWANGKPDRVQDMLNRANHVGGKYAVEGAAGYSVINSERIRRIAEVFTGESYVTHLGSREEGFRSSLIGGEQSMEHSQQPLRRRLYVKTRPAGPRCVAL
ncbi:hypothetical protein LTR48_003259 [Friedmanniomyces endolithicus]|uniref:Uncharacterized protein n=1 Tax=Rachicladosporium monterosium TaxID=1507873 RepID=A0ABR0L8Z6_9PEZI|nr:hypothetical protein LTR29_006553 [Friedmanniomyces endolithicus]KAK1092977.1 hypothetical protein LTR48_003259 [Friedmanniomyces endolithicus]KAK5145302.1 hypothetical protein LTR32_002924 [Rachicladosporium monterosium]